MTTDTRVTPDPDLHRELMKAWSNPPGWGWFTVVNHSPIALRFLITGIGFFLVGGVMAMLMRTQLALPNQDIVAPEIYNQLFTMHGTVMMFLFAIPVLEGMAMYLIPKMIGARDLVFPRLSAFGYFCYLFGGLILLSSIFFNMAPAAGWFMYTPLSDAVFTPEKGPDFWLLGITFVEISAIAGASELIVSILRSRANGMTLRSMPIFCWYILAMALMILFGFPPLILGSILLELERAAGWVFFAVEGGGDPLLWQHLFWLFGHPEVYIIFLPAAGIVSTLIPVFARRPLAGYGWIVLSIILIGFISFGLWVHHMFTVGIPQLAQAFFSVASMLVAIPTGIQIFAWLATLWGGRVVFSLPMLWIFGFLVIFVCGGLTGVMLALVPFNWQVHDTHFVVAHMHYVLVGGMLFPVLAGFYYWLPLLSGRLPSELLGRWGFWLTFAGFNLTFLLMHVTGLMGMPRRVYTYEAGLGWDWLNLLSSVGGFVMAAGIAVVIIDLALHFRFGRLAPQNPWNADTLEWALEMPPPPYNFVSLTPITTRHPLWEDAELPYTIAAGHHGLTDTTYGGRETWGTDALTGEIREVIHLPANSWLPLRAALMLAVVCISLLLKLYLLALGACGIAAVLLLRWSWHNGGHPAAEPLRDTEPREAPLHSRTTSGPGLWGMATTLLADGTLYLAAIFGWFYLWTVAPEWAVPAEFPLAVLPVLVSGILLSAGVFWYGRVATALAAGKVKHLTAGVIAVTLLGAGHVALLAWQFAAAALQPTLRAHDAVLSFLLYYLLFHGLVATLVTAMQARRVALGYISSRLPYEPQVLRLFWNFTLVVYWTAFAAFILLPMAWELP